MESYFRFWGKARPQLAAGPDWHPLAYHCLDVAAVGAVLLEHDARLQGQLAHITGATFEQLRPWFTLFFALHDLGKFSMAFQQQAPHVVERMLGPQAPRPSDIRHDRLGFGLYQSRLGNAWTAMLPALSIQQRPARASALDGWWAAVTGHHGQPPAGLDETEVDARFGNLGIEAARTFTREIHLLLRPGQLVLPSKEGIKQSSWLLAGLAVLADWLGSHQGFFPYQGFDPSVEPPFSLDDYWLRARKQATDAVEHAGVLPVPSARPQTFAQLFPAIAEPSPLQRLCETLPLAPGPQLFVIEDATGAGKTEAALALVHRLIAEGHADGVYMGMPTMATANGMYPRIVDVVPQLFDGRPSLVLAHSSARLAQQLRSQGAMLGGVEPPPMVDECTDARRKQLGTASQHATAWLSDSTKKALLAAVGVGTIDQALLAVLPARHSALRLLGLHRKVLVVDEVHACDVYMSTVLDHLLAFQATLGGSVILLSATLSHEQRARLLNAFTAPLGQAQSAPSALNQRQAGEGADYPSLVHAHAAPPTVHILPRSPRSTREVGVTFLHDEHGAQQLLLERARDRGCAAWVKNTVRDAIEAQRELQGMAGTDATVLLFHARFALGHRLAIEDEVLRRFGKASTPQERAGIILVATQVIEQSLDLDFDDLVSDLAPVDLLIQRAGRLRRHARLATGARATGVDERGPPCLHVFGPPWTEAPDASWLTGAGMKGTAKVYPAHAHLWRTMKVLQDRGALRIPDEARLLIESVYGPDAPTPEGLDKPMLLYEGTQMARESEAAFVALKPASGYQPASDGGTWQEDILVHTRLGDESCRVRLGVVEGGKLRPLIEAPEQPAWVAWSLSEVSVRADLIAAENPADEGLIEMAKKSMSDEGRFVVLLAMHPAGPGRWQGHALGRSGKQLRSMLVTYDLRTGLEAVADKREES